VWAIAFSVDQDHRHLRLDHESEITSNRDGENDRGIGGRAANSNLMLSHC
jgi:hypothetical protein